MNYENTKSTIEKHHIDENNLTYSFLKLDNSNFWRKGGLDFFTITKENIEKLKNEFLENIPKSKKLCEHETEKYLNSRKFYDDLYDKNDNCSKKNKRKIWMLIAPDKQNNQDICPNSGINGEGMGATEKFQLFRNNCNRTEMEMKRDKQKAQAEAVDKAAAQSAAKADTRAKAAARARTKVPPRPEFDPRFNPRTKVPPLDSGLS